MPIERQHSAKVLIQECKKVLGIEEFDEKTFLDHVDKIVVPEQHVMVFHIKMERRLPGNGYQLHGLTGGLLNGEKHGEKDIN